MRKLRRVGQILLYTSVGLFVFGSFLAILVGLSYLIDIIVRTFGAENIAIFLIIAGVGSVALYFCYKLGEALLSLRNL